MTREEALTQIIDALENVEEFDEALTTLRTPTEDETTWKAKYNDLAEKYKTRFKEEIMTQNSGALENRSRNQLHLNLYRNWMTWTFPGKQSNERRD